MNCFTYRSRLHRPRWRECIGAAAAKVLRSRSRMCPTPDDSWLSQSGCRAGKGRKWIMTPKGAAVPATKPDRDDPLIKTRVRPHPWRGRSRAGKRNRSPILADQERGHGRLRMPVLPLTCLAVVLVEAILRRAAMQRAEAGSDPREAAGGTGGAAECSPVAIRTQHSAHRAAHFTSAPTRSDDSSWRGSGRQVSSR